MKKYTSENYIVPVYSYHNEGVPGKVVVIEYLLLFFWGNRKESPTDYVLKKSYSTDQNQNTHETKKQKETKK